ncbi:MAG: hypothetical protein FJ264_17585 [Planctomycetes bacterium]|nr:hypothetical protein [Planctomycetota bacterium]
MGKTILSIGIADAISRGISFLGQSTMRTQVIYVDFENALPVLVERVRRINAGQVLFWHTTNEIKPPRLDSKEYELCKQLPEGALLIFDTLRASQSKDENDSQHMAFVMQRLKELRDTGFTILILHHTKKSDDRVYKGSTAIYDLCDHVLSLHKVRKGSYSPDENDGDEDSEDSCYFFGTKDKTRYEPFQVFLEFDPEKKYFVQAQDPETEIMEEIHGLLINGRKDRFKTNEIFDMVKAGLCIKSKGKVSGLLKKGTGKFWTCEKCMIDNKTIFYTPVKSLVRQSHTIGLDQRTNGKSLVQINRTNEHIKKPESFVNIDKSVSPEVVWTNQTNDKSLVQTGQTNEEMERTNDFDLEQEKPALNSSENITEPSLENFEEVTL